MKKAAALLMVIAVSAACATFSREYKLGTIAEMNRQYDEAVSRYQKAALENPKNQVYHLAIARARAAASLYYLVNARTLAAQSKKDEALTSYNKALAYDPSNEMLMKEIQEFRQPPQPKPVVVEETLQPPLSLRAGHDRLNMTFRADVSVKSVFQAISRTAGINFLFDEQYRDQNMAIDLAGKEVEQAIGYLCAATKNFYRVMDDKTVLIAPDNMQKRQQYELTAIKTFYLSNVNVQDVQQPLAAIMRSTYKTPNIQVDKNLNTLTVRDTPQVVDMIGHIIRKWDKPRGEVLIDVEIMEVSRQKEQSLGLDLSNTTLSFRIYPTGTDSDEYFSLKGFKFSNASNYQMYVPSAVLDFIGTDTDTKIIAQPRFRGVSGEDIRYMVGQKVPVVNTTYYPLVSGSVSSEPIVSYAQQDVGIEIKLKPRIHLEKEVTLEMEIKVSAISGYATTQDIPIIATREIKNTIRLKDGETNLLAGLLYDEKSEALSGIPGLKDLPLLGRLFSNTNTTIQKQDVIITITPHIIRSLDISKDDTDPLWIEPDALAAVAGSGEQKQDDGPAAKNDEGGTGDGAPAGNALYLSPSALDIRSGREFKLNLELSSEKEIASLSTTVNYDPSVLQIKEIQEGGLLKQMGDNVPFLKTTSGSTCTLGFSSPLAGRGFKGRGSLAVIIFEPVGTGDTTVSVSGISALGADRNGVQLDAGQTKITIKAKSPDAKPQDK